MALDLRAWDRVIAGVPDAVDQGTFDAATMIADLARQLAPVDTGRLRDSGHVAPAAPNGGAVYQVVFDAPYAVYVEEGTTNPNYPAQPFLGPARKDISLPEAIRVRLRALVQG